MNKNHYSITHRNDHASESCPQPFTADLPSDSIMTTRLIRSSQAEQRIHQYSTNQNQTSINECQNSNPFVHSQTSDPSFKSHRTVSSVDLFLTRKDVDDVIKALCTLTHCIQNENQRIEQEDSRRLSTICPINRKRRMKNSKSIAHSLNRSNPLRFSSKKHFDRHQSDAQYDDVDPQLTSAHQPKKIVVEKFDQNASPVGSYPSHLAQKILDTSACKSDQETMARSLTRRRCNSQNRYHSLFGQKLSSKIPLSSYLLDKLVYSRQHTPNSNVRILPRRAQTFVVDRIDPAPSVMSIDSLLTKNRHFRLMVSEPTKEINQDTTFPYVEDRIRPDKLDASTQWTLQASMSKSTTRFTDENRLLVTNRPDEHDNSIIEKPTFLLADISHSTTTVLTKHSILPSQTTINNIPSIIRLNDLKESLDNHFIDDNPSSVTLDNDCKLTPSETERFLHSLNLPTCQCPTEKFSVGSDASKTAPVNDTIVYLSLSDNVSKTKKTKRQQRTVKKLNAKRIRRSFVKSSKPIQHRRTFRTDDSSSDLFDADSTLFDTCDRLF